MNHHDQQRDILNNFVDEHRMTFSVRKKCQKVPAGAVHNLCTIYGGVAFKNSQFCHAKNNQRGHHSISSSRLDLHAGVGWTIVIGVAVFISRLPGNHGGRHSLEKRTKMGHGFPETGCPRPMGRQGEVRHHL
eukprot:scaffold585888_cov63-Attheya_sp.AAC.2